jgi:putative nucleotidyltransferase with HDIG domain
MSYSVKVLRRQIESIKQLPTLPQVMERVMSVITDPNSSASDLGREIAKDQSLTAKILRMVNSAFYGFYRQIDSVDDAVVILGYNEVRILALTVSVFDSFGPSKTGWNRTHFWEHALATAVGTEYLAQGSSTLAKEAYIAGLLHDIGKVAFDKLLGSEWMRILLRAEKDDYPLHDLETEEFGASHATAGGWLAERWHLPERIAQAVARHHETTTGHGENCLVPLVQLSNAIVKDEDIGHSGNPVKNSISPLDYEPIWPPQLKVPDEGGVADLRAKVKEQSRAISAALNYAGGGPTPPSRR